MSKLAAQISASRGLLNAVEGITNYRAFLVLFVTMLSGALLSSGFAWLSVNMLMRGYSGVSSALALFGAVLMFAVFLIGGSTTGFMLNDQMRGRDVRGIGAALTAALATLPRVLAVGGLLLLLGLGVMLAVAIILLICKIPLLGPVLYTVAFPVCALVLGVAAYAFMFVAGLSGPAIWEGNTAMQTIALLWAIVRKKLLVVLIQVILLGLLVGLIGGLIGAALLMGAGMTSGLSASILSMGYGGFGLGSMMHGMGGFGGEGSSYLLAAGIGGSVLASAGFVAPMLVAICGNCVVFAGVTEDLDTSEYEKALQDKLAQARQKAEESRRPPAAPVPVVPAVKMPPPPPVPSAPPAPPVDPVVVAAPVQVASVCPSCKTAITPDDAFCGECGQHLN